MGIIHPIEIKNQTAITNAISFRNSHKYLRIHIFESICWQLNTQQYSPTF